MCKVGVPVHPSEIEGRIVRHAVRVVLIDAAQSVLLLSTRDASNPAFGESWELPGGGIASGETLVEAAIREMREETGFRLSPSQLGEPIWRRAVLYTYRGERRLQHEAICVARIAGTAPPVDTAGRETFEQEDHLFHRWWRAADLQTSAARFYPASLPRHIGALLRGSTIVDPWESWEEG